LSREKKQNLHRVGNKKEKNEREERGRSEATEQKTEKLT
jgi:hypothetical protein